MRLFFPLSGDDVFISYSRRDGALYAAGLADKLTERKLSCFIDKLGTEPNHDLPPSLKKKIKNCTVFVLVGTEKATQSEFVKKEIAEFKQTGRTILPIDFDGNVGKAIWYDEIPGLAVETEKDSESLETGNPSQNVTSYIEKSFNYTRRNQYMSRLFWSALSVFLVLVGLGVGASYYAVDRINFAKVKESEATEAENKAIEATEKAKKAEENAINQELIAKDAKKEATIQSEIADEKNQLALAKTKLADEKTKLADLETKRANEETQKANTAKNEADKQAQIAIVKTEEAKQAGLLADNAKRETYTEIGRQELLNNYPFRASVYLNEAYKIPDENEDERKNLLFLLGQSMKSVDSLRFTLKNKDSDSSTVFSLDLDNLAIVNVDSVRILDVSLGDKTEKSPLFQEKQEGISLVEFSNDGENIAIVENDGTIKIKNLKTKETFKPFTHPGGVESAKFSPDGTKIMTKSSDTIMLWDFKTGTKLIPDFNFSRIDDLASFSPDGTKLALVSSSEVVIWDLTTNKKLRLTPFPKNEIPCSAEFSYDGKKLVVAFNKQSAIIYDLESKLKPVLLTHGDGVVLDEFAKFMDGIDYSVRYAEFSPDGTKVVTASNDTTAKVWDVITGKPLFLLNHTNMVVSAKFSPDGKQIVTSSSDKTAKVWDVETGKMLSLLEHEDAVISAQFSLDGKKIGTICENGTARVWDVEERKVFATKYKDEIISSKIISDGKKILIASHLGIQVFENEIEKEFRLWKSPGYVRKVGFSSDGKKVVTENIENDKKTVVVSDLETGTIITTLKPCPDFLGDVILIEFSLDGTKLIIGDDGSTLRVYDSQTGKCLNWPSLCKDVDPISSEPICNDINSISSGKDGSKIILSDTQGEARIWNLKTSELTESELTELESLDVRSAVLTVEISIDEKKIVTANEDKTVNVWDSKTQKLLVSFSDGEKMISAKFSLNGKMIVTTSEAENVKVWDAETGNLLAFIASAVKFPAEFSSDGKMILTVGDKTKIWNLDFETRSKTQIENIVKEKVPFCLTNGVLVPRDLTQKCPEKLK